MRTWTSFFSLGKKDYEKELDELQSKIKNTEASLLAYRENERSISAKWVVASVFVYIATLFIAYLNPVFVSTPLERGIWVAFLIGGPIIIYFTNRLLISFFRHKIKSTEKILDFLKSEQTSKMEEIKRKESYYKAKQLLERYETPKEDENGPRLRHVSTSSNRAGGPALGPSTPQTPGQSMGQKGIISPSTPSQEPFRTPQGIPPQGFTPQGFTPQGIPPQGFTPQGIPPQGFTPQGIPFQGIPPQSPMQVRPYQPVSWVDKLVDYAVGGSEAVEMLSKLQRENAQLKQMLQKKHEEVMQLRDRLEPDRAPQENFPSTPTPVRNSRDGAEEETQQQQPEEQPVQENQGEMQELSDQTRRNILEDD